MARDEIEELGRRLQMTSEAVKNLSPRSDSYLTEARELWREVNSIRERLYEIHLQTKQRDGAPCNVH